jgi:hypothetical protein
LTTLPPKGQGSNGLLPRGTIVGIVKNLATTNPELFDKALRRGLAAGGAKSFPYFALAAAYTDGKPIERLLVVADTRLLFVPSSDGQPPAAIPGIDEDSDP